jgi:HEAT repeat protein
MQFLRNLFKSKKLAAAQSAHPPPDASASVEDLAMLAVHQDFDSLAKALQHEDPDVRAMVVTLIAMAGKPIRGQGDAPLRDNPQAVELLITALSDKAPAVKAAAAQELRKMNNPKANQALAAYHAHQAARPI